MTAVRARLSRRKRFRLTAAVIAAVIIPARKRGQRTGTARAGNPGARGMNRSRNSRPASPGTAP
jgi:hypothetical protein